MAENQSKKGGSDSDYSEKGREFVSEHTSKHIKEKGMPQDQAVAAAMDEARRKGYKVPEEKKGGNG